MTTKISGVICAVVTPFGADDQVDESCLRSHIEFLIQAGVDGLLVTGGCGEFLNLDDGERQRVMRAALDAARHRVPVIIGILSPDTRHVCLLARQAADAGADAVMVLPPYYVSPSAIAIRDHFVRVAGECGLPIVLYNNPARTNINMDLHLLLQLTQSEQVVAIKDCDRDLTRISEKLHALGERAQLLSGEDDLAFPTLMLGAPGGIWATANLFPKIFIDMYRAVKAGNADVARHCHYRLLPLWKACLVPDHPAALKAAMAMCFRPVGKARPPMPPASKAQLAAIRSALAAVEQPCAPAPVPG